MQALQADASRLLAEYDSSNSAGNKLQRRLLTCEHTFQLLNDRFSCVSLRLCCSADPLLGLFSLRGTTLFGFSLRNFSVFFKNKFFYSFKFCFVAFLQV